MEWNKEQPKAVPKEFLKCEFVETSIPFYFRLIFAILASYILVTIEAIIKCRNFRGYFSVDFLYLLDNAVQLDHRFFFNN